MACRTQMALQALWQAVWWIGAHSGSGLLWMSSTMVQNGGVKLTGWAQAAAKALPKQQQQQRPKAAAAGSSAKNGSASVLTASGSAASLSSANGRGKKKPVRQPYNRDEVRSYMKSLFEEQVAKLGNRETFSTGRGSQRKNGSLDWGAVTSNKYRNKKYGCLNEIAQVLCK
ncbi:hypothetical protein HG536_0E01470 [Torulaspora globosa]|uniref:Uncharacterized protein n=1 Tax=Torulaspora globosa TaxID=48254 RepID=A0A7G3ZIA0_9SACH|nr:uncharacterized protein HG536_0E01470 [Torulaspora globosa]QLL33236.1 hypothetical protein HG536_0E01470 [Torulaspora globosa]